MGISKDRFVKQEDKIEIKQQISVDDLEVKEVKLDSINSKFKDVIEKYKLRNDGVEKHYVFVSFKGMIQLVITAQGVDYLCRSQVKEVHIVDIKTTFTSGVPTSVLIIVRVKTVDDRSYDEIGTVPVKESFEKAQKHAMTNARMRALRAAVGINIPDEVTLREIGE